MIYKNCNSASVGNPANFVLYWLNISLSLRQYSAWTSSTKSSLGFSFFFTGIGAPTDRIIYLTLKLRERTNGDHLMPEGEKSNS